MCHCLGEVRLADLQEADDAAARAVGRGMVRLLCVVLGEDLISLSPSIYLSIYTYIQMFN